MPIPSREEIKIAIVCALDLEYNAVYLLFDEVWDQDGGKHKYKVGYIGGQKAVLALLSKTGKGSAASTATMIWSDYPGIRLAFLVGVCGGVPRPGDPEQEILLGDVVISNAILQYDFGKQYPDKFSTTENSENYISLSDKYISTQLATLGTDDGRDELQKRTAAHLKKLQEKAAQKNRGHRYIYLGADKDRLFKPYYRHKHRVLQNSECTTCDKGLEGVCSDALRSTCEALNCIDEEQLISRKRLEKIRKLESKGGFVHEPAIHIGLVGSGDTVIKSGEHRDAWAKSQKIIAFEMEGAGISAIMQCIIVKGVCDYADSHKSGNWQNFAAATAASALKAILQSCSLYKCTTDVCYEFQSPGAQSPQTLRSAQSPPPAYSTLEPVVSKPLGSTSNGQRNKRTEDLQKKLPELVQSIAEDLKKKLQWTPYLSAAPSAIVVMATCLVAGSSTTTSNIKLDIRPVEMNGVTIKPSKYLGTNLQECSDLGKKAFRQAEQGMKKLQGRAEFVTGKTGPLAGIVLALSDSQPDFDNLEILMKDIIKVADICQSEAALMKDKFQSLLDFVTELKRATIEALNEKKQQLKDEEKEKAVKNEYDCRLQQAEIEKTAMERELEEAKADSQAAQEKITKLLKENPCEKIQARITQIDSELHKIEKQGSSWFAFGRYFRSSKGSRTREQEEKNLRNERKKLESQREEHISRDQKDAIDKSETCQKRVAEAEHRLRVSQETYMTLVKNNFQSVKSFSTACEDLKKMSDTNLDLKEISLILLRSIQALRELNKYIEQMSKFFMNVSDYVEGTMSPRLDALKQKTEDVKKRATLRTEEENDKHKNFATMAALELHGRFTLINNIAGVYVDVSENYIMHGITEMEDLTLVEEDEMGDKMVNFAEWGKKAVADIEALAAATNAQIEDAVFKNVGSLVQKQIGTGDFDDANDD